MALPTEGVLFATICARGHAKAEARLRTENKELKRQIELMKIRKDRM